MTTIELFEKLKEKFPLCFFTHKGNIILIHEESMIDGYRAYGFTRFKFPYLLGVHHELSHFISDNGFYNDFNKNNELIIKKEK